MGSDGAGIEIFSPVRADVYVHGEAPLPLVEYLDRAGIRVVCDVSGLPSDEHRLRRIAGACAGCISVAAERPPVPHLKFTNFGPELENYIAGLTGTPAYAFFIGRLERDFTHAREALRAAVEAEAGMTLLWSGDGCHRTPTDSVRADTEMLLKHAAFVIADLSLGVENPQHENPSRAHEIGLSSAFARPLLLCSREPRRYPYFSIGDLQMFFWSDERDLHERAVAWICAHRAEIARTVANTRLPEPRIRAATFTFDPERRYLWPENRPLSASERLVMSVSLGAIVLSIGLMAGMQERLGAALWPAAACVAVATWMATRRLTMGRFTALLPSFLVLGALSLVTTVLFLGVP